MSSELLNNAAIVALAIAGNAKAEAAFLALLAEMNPRTGAARREALEYAARICDYYVMSCRCTYRASCVHHGAFQVGTAIRALIDRTPKCAEARERGEGPQP